MKWKQHINLHVRGFYGTEKILTLAMFSTGWGDGLYATYIGYDSENLNLQARL